MVVEGMSRETERENKNGGGENEGREDAIPEKGRREVISGRQQKIASEK